MKKLARNTLALGTATLIVTAGLSFSANGAEERYTYKSYAEAQYISASGALLGSALVDPLADFLEGGGLGADTKSAGAVAKVDSAAGTPEVVGPNYTSSPIDFLNQLTGPAGDLLGAGSVGAVGSYAKSDKRDSTAASGAVTNDGLVDLDTASASSYGHAKLQLAGPGSPLAPLAALANVTLDLGALGSETSNVNGTPVHRTEIAGGQLVLDVPALGQVLDPILGLTSGLGSIGLVGGVPETVDALSTLTGKGVKIDLKAGKITVDIDALLISTTGKNLNGQPANTPLLPVIIDGVVKQLPELTTGLSKNLLPTLRDNLTIGGVPLKDLLAPVVALVQPILDAAVTPLLADLASSIADPITQLFDALTPLVDLRINVQEKDAGSYRESIAARLPTSAGVLSTTAVRVALLNTSGAPALAVNLGNSLVGPSSRTAVTPTPSPTNSDAAAGDADSPSSDNDSDSDGSDADGAAAGDGSDSIADADAQADADVTTTLPSTGASNLLPFWLLGIALLLFGGAVLVNEKRRLSASI
ncbi:choice-of-anchor G family protein [Aeromicrobium wangtongii]|uniref:Choice-of-anchor G family protein n=1 Tax=Aeromicrobium wangtongii TaxID=2969247 RepID=A0ABY5MG03_9ACTN|nr:choice-of-anchor G family protein [Aeromicrobium wangtongii]MCD9197291.1 choice-of-anchor G family protein [Aeromicrobium wangtongii]UUP14786.1 choice-of-anchor G family protein [Aeromicrobium wangtongii]